MHHFVSQCLAQAIRDTTADFLCNATRLQAANIKVLDLYEDVYSTMRGLVRQAVQNADLYFLCQHACDH